MEPKSGLEAPLDKIQKNKKKTKPFNKNMGRNMKAQAFLKESRSKSDFQPASNKADKITLRRCDLEEFFEPTSFQDQGS